MRPSSPSERPGIDYAALCSQIDENGKNSCLTRELDITTLKLLEKLLITIVFEARDRFFPLKPVSIFTGALELSSCFRNT